MRERRGGAIVSVTSQGGRVTGPLLGAYCASKFALEAASESLAIEVAPFGVRVVIIEPGVVITRIFEKVPAPPLNEDAVRQRHRLRQMTWFGALLKEPTTPEEVAAILEALTTEVPRLRYSVGSEAEALLRNRGAMTDEEWIAMSNLESEEEFWARFSQVWGDKARLF